VIVILETNGSLDEVKEAIMQLLGESVVDVVEMRPGTFEIIVANKDVAQQLIEVIQQCMAMN